MNATSLDGAPGLFISLSEQLASLLPSGHSGLEIREWNALIGIVTAIVGNILISFALNIQRYAHIRLSKDRDTRKKSWSDGKGKRNGVVDYSTEQARIAAERATLNFKAASEDEQYSSHPKTYQSNGQEDDASSLGRSLHSQSSSDSTVRQEKTENAASPSTTYLKSPYWWAGILLMTTGEAGNFLAYGFAPASIVSPLGVVALVSNCIIAPWLLKERFRQRDFWGVIVAVAGAVTVVLSAKNSETKMGPGDVWTAITRWEFEVYLGITSGMIVALMWASGRYGETTILIDLGLVGLFGAYTALSTKGVASLLSDTLWRALTFPITYLLVFILVSTALLQIRYVNRALQRFDSTQVIPTQFVLFTLSVIIGSAVLYRDFESATIDRVGKFVGGCALTFLGVYLITSGRSGEESSEDDGDMEDEEQPIALVDEEAQDNEAHISDDGNPSKRRSLASITVYDGASPQKEQRRLSRQQSSGQTSLPRTPRRFNSSTSSNLSPLTTPGRDLQLLENPWSSQERLGLRQSLQSTASSPVLPSEAQGQRPSASRGQSQQHLGPPQADRPLTLTRNSISRMMPGPLLSPLSSSLSAIVADNLRRGVDSPIRSRRRRGLSGLRKSGSHRHEDGVPDEESGLLASSPYKGSEARQDGGSEGPSRSKGRSQSLGMTFGEILGFTRGKRKSEEGGNGAGEEEPGGSAGGR